MTDTFRYLKLSALMMLVMLANRSQVSRAAAAPAQTEGRNAATLYQRAFDRLPPADSIESEFLRDPNQTPLGGPVDRFLLEHEQTAKLLHEAALLDQCEWAASTEWRSLQDTVKKVRELGDLERLRFRQLLDQQRMDDALQEAADLVVLGRHVGRLPMSSARLVAADLQEAAILEIVAGLSTGSDPALAVLRKRIDTLPRWFSAAEVLDAEGKMIASELRKLETAKSPDLFAKGSMLFDVTGANAGDTAVRTQVRATWSDPSKRGAAMVEVIKLFADASRIAGLSKSQVGSSLAEWGKKRAVADVLPQLLAPSAASIERLRMTCLIGEVRAAMIRAAVAGRISGTDEALKTLDPYTNRPFALREWGEGFELKSTLNGISPAKPLTILVGKPEKPEF